MSCHPHITPHQAVIFVMFRIKTVPFINVVGLKNFEMLIITSASQIKILY